LSNIRPIASARAGHRRRASQNAEQAMGSTADKSDLHDFSLG
jgi:hypothetical protein